MARHWSCKSFWLGSPPKHHQNGQGIWLYNAGIRHRLLRFLLFQRRLQDLRSTRFEAFAVEQAIAADPDLSLLIRLVTSEQVAAPAAAGPRIPTLSSEYFSKKSKFLWRCCKCRVIFVTTAWLPCTPLINTVSVFHAWAPPTAKQHSPGRKVTTAVI